MERREFLVHFAAGGVGMLAAPVCGIPSTYAIGPATQPTEMVTAVELSEPFELRIGRGLLPLFGKRGTSPICAEIQNLRSRLARLGIGMPPIRIRDFVDLAADEFAILVCRRIVDRGQVPIASVHEPIAHRQIVERIGVIACRYSDELTDKPATSSLRREVILQDDRDDWIVTN